MQPRPIRSQLYLPVLRFVITDEDWGFVILASVVGYTIPFLMSWKIFRIPAELIGWLIMMGISVLLLNLMRRKNRAGWLKHSWQAWRLGRVLRRWESDERGCRWRQKE